MTSGLEQIPSAQERWIETYLSQAGVEAALASSPDDAIYISQKDLLAIDPGEPASAGRYIYAGQYFNYSRFYLEGHVPGDSSYSVQSNGSFWVVTDAFGVELYQAPLVPYPWDAVWSARAGALPVPTIVPYPTVKALDRSKLLGIISPIVLTGSITTTLEQVGSYFVLPTYVATNKILTIDDSLIYANGARWYGANVSATRTLGVALGNNPTDLVLAGAGTSGSRMSVAPWGKFRVEYIKSTSGGQDFYLIDGTGVTVVP